MCQYISGVALALVGTVITVYNIMHTAMHNIQEIMYMQQFIFLFNTD